MLGYGIIPENSLELYITGANLKDYSPVEVATHALLVRELYDDGLKVYGREKQFAEPTMKTHEYQFMLKKETCSMLGLDYMGTIAKIAAHDMWSLFQGCRKSVILYDIGVKVNELSGTVDYKIYYDAE